MGIYIIQLVSSLETTLHIVDPKNPGGVDEILNLGEYWNEAGMVLNKQEIINYNKDIKALFYSAYHYLASAKEMQDDIETIIDEAVDRVGLNKLIIDLRTELLGNVNVINKKSEARHLFDSAITPDGVMDYIDTIIPKNYSCYHINLESSKISTEIIKAIADECLLKGYSVEMYHQPLNPERVQTLVIDSLKLAITTNPKIKNRAVKIIDIDNILDNAKVKENADRLEKDTEMIRLLMAEAVRRISIAKKKHDDMEKCYIPNMNFKAISELRAKTIKRIKDILSIENELHN